VIDHTDYKDIPSVGKVVEQRWSEKQYIAVDSPITIDEEHQGHVFMFANTNIVKNMVNHLSDQFVIVGLITIVLTIFTVFILSRFIHLPIMKIKESTEQLRKEKHQVQLHMERKDELDELAVSIMRLSSDLNRLKKDINQFLASISHEHKTPL